MYKIQAIKHLSLSRARQRPTARDDNIINEYKSWCTECVGVNNWNYYGGNKRVPHEFRFKDEQDLLAFKLKFNL